MSSDFVAPGTYQFPVSTLIEKLDEMSRFGQLNITRTNSGRWQASHRAPGSSGWSVGVDDALDVAVQEACGLRWQALWDRMFLGEEDDFGGVL